jgi:DNA-binding beta-propeller fold protein YncE
MLSDFSGAIPSQWARLDVDQRHQEIYTFNRGERRIQIFNDRGMETFSFDLQGNTASVADMAVGDNGAIYLLSSRGDATSIMTLDYRGEPTGRITLSGLPPAMETFHTDRLVSSNGAFYLVDSTSLRILVLDGEGRFKQLHRIGVQLQALARQQEPENKKTLHLEIGGFAVDDQGVIYFTVPVLFAAFRLNNAGILESFGRSGSGPGKFGVVAGIAGDEHGNIYVSDRLRSVVMVFDHTFEFLGEFGYRGPGEENLIVPDDIAVDSAAAKVYVAQAANRGVSVFRLDFQ